MASRREKTATPGIFRRGTRYDVSYRDPQGRQRWRSARTLTEARALKAALKADVARGEYRELSQITFADYAAQWSRATPDERGEASAPLHSATTAGTWSTLLPNPPQVTEGEVVAGPT